MADVDDGSIADAAGLLRRIHPDQVIEDPNEGGARPSSAAFKDPSLSVDAEPILTSNGLNWQFSLKDHSSHSLVRFPAKAARDKQLAVVHKPEENNKAHTEVIGKKTKGVANFLRDASEWVHQAPKTN
jgi:hypothetical protein